MPRKCPKSLCGLVVVVCVNSFKRICVLCLYLGNSFNRDNLARYIEGLTELGKTLVITLINAFVKIVAEILQIS